MGFLGTLVGFGAGYVAGMKLGDKPVQMIQDTTKQMREKAGRSSVDVRMVPEVMTPGVETIAPDDTLAVAAKRMSEANIGDVLVVDASGQLCGSLPTGT
jgi:CBS domain-containing protein